MADYVSMNAALDAGITNMTVIRNNSGQDDGHDVVSTNVDWFYFNSTKVTTLYVSGNSWIGFINQSTENLKVNRRDTNMYYLYKESGSIGTINFIKIRWEGYSTYSATSSSYEQAYDVFILSNGQIVLSFYKIPTSNFSGANQLICGAKTVTFSPSSSSTYWTFTSSDPQNGSDWSVSEGYPNITASYKTNGTVEFSSTNLRKVTKLGSSSISWVADVPDDTSLKIFTKVDDGEYVECMNESSIPNFNIGDDLSDSTLYVKVEMSTANPQATPTLSKLEVKIFDVSDDKVLLLNFASGNNGSIRNAVGEVTIIYSGGNLKGEGGVVSPFEKTFIPEGLVPKNNQNMLEHIELSDIKATANLIKIGYVNSKSDEHIEVSNVLAVATLTHVNDI